MTIKDEIIAEIQKGRAGNNQGLSMGLPKLESIIDGVCQETYTLIISNSGAGKYFAVYNSDIINYQRAISVNSEMKIPR